MAVHVEGRSLRLSPLEENSLIDRQQWAAFFDMSRAQLVQAEITHLLEFLLAPQALVANTEAVKAVVESLNVKLMALCIPAGKETSPQFRALHAAALESVRILYGTTAEIQEQIRKNASLTMEEGIVLRVQLLRVVITQLFKNWGFFKQ